MNSKEARRRIWERLRTTVIGDIDIGDWMHDDHGGEEQSADPKTIEALTQASHDIADIIDRMFLKKRKPKK